MLGLQGQNKNKALLMHNGATTTGAALSSENDKTQSKKV
jgi:hypothetical protein